MKLVKAKYYLQSQEDPTKSVTHGKNYDEKYERNIHIIKIIIQAVLLCREQDSSNDIGKNSDTERKMQRGNFFAIINPFTPLDAVLMGHLEKGAKNAKMVSWQIQNDIIKYLIEFVRSKTTDETPDYYAIIAAEFTHRFSNKKFYYCV